MARGSCPCNRLPLQEPAPVPVHDPCTRVLTAPLPLFPAEYRQPKELFPATSGIPVPQMHRACNYVSVCQGRLSAISAQSLGAMSCNCSISIVVHFTAQYDSRRLQPDSRSALLTAYLEGQLFLCWRGVVNSDIRPEVQRQ